MYLRRFVVQYRWLLHGKPSLRQIPVLWLVLSRSGFCSTDRFHGNGPIRVFLFLSEAGKFKFATKTANKKCECCHSSHWKYEKKLKKLKFFRNFKDGLRRRTFLNASHRKCILLSETECHIINNHFARSVLPRPRANIPQYGPSKLG